MSGNDALVRRHVAAVNAGDADALLADFAPDATWVTGTYAVPVGELEPFFREAMTSLRPRLEVRRIVDGGDVVAVEMQETWTHDGSAREAAIVAVLTLHGGRIAAARVYREGSADA